MEDKAPTVFGHGMQFASPFLATVRIFLAMSTYNNLSKLMVWHSDKSPHVVYKVPGGPFMYGAKGTLI